MFLFSCGINVTYTHVIQIDMTDFANEAFIKIFYDQVIDEILYSVPQ